MSADSQWLHLAFTAASLWLGVYAWLQNTLLIDPSEGAPPPRSERRVGVHHFWFGLYALVLGAFASGWFAASGVGLSGDIALFAICSTAVVLTWLRGVIRTLPFGARLARADLLNRPNAVRSLAAVALVLAIWLAVR